MILEGPTGTTLSEMADEFEEATGTTSFPHFIRWLKELKGFTEVQPWAWTTWTLKPRWFEDCPDIEDQLNAQREGKAPLFEPVRVDVIEDA